MASMASSEWLVTIRWERWASSRATSTKHSSPNGHRAAPRQSRWLTLTWRHSRSVWRGARSRSPLPSFSASCSAQARSSRTFLPASGPRALRDLDQAALLVVGHPLADPLETGVVGAALEHGVRRVDLGVGAGDRLDQPRDVALDELVLEGQGGGRDHDPLVVEEGRDEVGQRLAGAGAGLDDQVPMVGQRVGDGLGHGDLSGAFLAAESLDRRPQHVGDG